MKPIHSLIPLAGLLTSSGLALAHGQHAEVPAASLLHLLAHNWPLLLGAASLLGLHWVARRRH